MLENLNHVIQGRGAEGAQRHFGADGKLIKGEGRVELDGLNAYRAELMERMGQTPEPTISVKPGSKGIDALNQLAGILGQRGLA